MTVRRNHIRNPLDGRKSADDGLSRIAEDIAERSPAGLDGCRADVSSNVADRRMQPRQVEAGPVVIAARIGGSLELDFSRHRIG